MTLNDIESKINDFLNYLETHLFFQIGFFAVLGGVSFFLLFAFLIFYMFYKKDKKWHTQTKTR